MNFNSDLLALILKEDRLVARKVLKCMALNIALETTKGNDVNLEYIGTFKKRGRSLIFEESDYLNTLRSSKMTPIEFLNSILTEDDQLLDKLTDDVVNKISNDKVSGISRESEQN